MEAHSLNGRPLHARLATATCIARARAPFMLQPLCSSPHSPATQRGRLVERACEGGHLQKTDRRVPPDAPPEGNANVAACPLLSAEATGESKDSCTE